MCSPPSGGAVAAAGCDVHKGGGGLAHMLMVTTPFDEWGTWGTWGDVTGDVRGTRRGRVKS